MKTYIGIDPGKSGAMAIMHANGEVEVIPFDAVKYSLALSKVHEASNDVMCCVEKVSAMPGQGVVSMFNFGHNLGVIEGLLRGYSIPYQLVPPQTWKKEFSLSSDKAKSIEVCQKLFPNVSLLATERSRKPNDGIAEALLMAEYARRKL
jgi:crossover junction endodeoxyribonuclease RuvC